MERHRRRPGLTCGAVVAPTGYADLEDTGRERREGKTQQRRREGREKFRTLEFEGSALVQPLWLPARGSPGAGERGGAASRGARGTATAVKVRSRAPPPAGGAQMVGCHWQPRRRRPALARMGQWWDTNPEKNRGGCAVLGLLAAC